MCDVKHLVGWSYFEAVKPHDGIDTADNRSSFYIAIARLEVLLSARDCRAFDYPSQKTMLRSPERREHESCPDRNTNQSQEIRPTSLPAPLSGAEATQALLKAKIREIQSSPVLTPKQKAESVQNLMMKDWNDAKSKAGAAKIECDKEAERKQKSYHDEAKTVLGCSHYQRKCKLLGKCCGKWYPCRFCHDDNEDHAFDRYAVDTVSCMKCDTVQPIGQICMNEDCKCEFGRYYCEVCRFLDDDHNKDIYHCDKCKICRIGKGLDIDYFHCDRCNACMSITLKKHKCVERSLESDCPICHAYMFTSTTPVMFLPCGHCMHVSCYEEYTLTNYICPLCSKSLGDMELYFASIDELLERERMPVEYDDYKSLIYCSDCERKSTTKFHFVYHKCQFEDCMSYNTKLLRQFKDSDGQVACGPISQTHPH